MSNPLLEEFLRGYLVAALWSSTSTHPQTGQDVDLDSDNFEWGEHQEDRLKAEATKFFERYRDDLELYTDQISYDPSQGTAYDYAGHDLWLTRNGHGCGFWDRGLGDVGLRLTKACGHGTDFPGIDLYFGDDVKIYAGGMEGEQCAESA